MVDGAPVVLGIDAGTTAVKATVLTGEGEEIATARTDIGVRRPGRDRAEQDPRDVWAAVARTVREAVARAAPATVSAVGVTGQGDGAWLLDSGHAPVGPALLWLDGRAARRVRDWQSDGRGELLRRVTGAAPFSGALPVLLDELADTAPDLLVRARHHANCKDWIRLQLTGVLETDSSEASRTYLDVATGRYSAELLAGLGHDRYADLLPPVVPAGAHRPLRPGPAGELGLRAGIPVVTGLVDTVAAGVGLGVLDPGQSYAIIGTTGFVGTVHPHAGHCRSGVGITVATGTGSTVVESLCPMSGSPNLDWVRSATGSAHLAWDEVSELVLSVAPGAEGVLYLPYGAEAGERAPFVDGAATASWLGVTTTTTPAQLMRAVYEGIALSMRECRETLGGRASLRMCGGAASSDTVCRIVADVTGCRIERPRATELGARGVAALALTAVTGHDLASATGALLGELDVFEPEPAHRDLHDRQFATFVAVRDAVRPHWPALRTLRSGAATPHPTA
ncbi:FGGY family carbohydrate kinase [Pseudonocardia nematodicida]|uniref:FGGY family carbohydrate kinase n=1 Tax=Pseudonocardia nematodicida TaxID=1206997 RepID=A0ABV1KF38_9PSEU